MGSCCESVKLFGTFLEEAVGVRSRQVTWFSWFFPLQPTRPDAVISRYESQYWQLVELDWFPKIWYRTGAAEERELPLHN